jgi:hypothetical protein
MAEVLPITTPAESGAFGTGSGDGHATPKWVLQSAAG